MQGKKLVGFASDLERHRGEVVADFQQFYGLALPLEGGPEDFERMALLWEFLPATSRTARRQCPELEWGVEAYLLRLIENEVAGLVWGMSDPKKRAPWPPEPVRMPGELAEARRHRDNALASKDEITRLLGLEGMVDG